MNVKDWVNASGASQSGNASSPAVRRRPQRPTFNRSPGKNTSVGILRYARCRCSTRLKKYHFFFHLERSLATG